VYSLSTAFIFVSPGSRRRNWMPQPGGCLCRRLKSH